MLAYPLFFAAINYKELESFNKLSTGCKIRILLEKDIFALTKFNEVLWTDYPTFDRPPKLNFRSVDLDSLDFNSLNNIEFSFLGLYEIDEFTIYLNELVKDDFQNSIEFKAMHIFNMLNLASEIDFEVNTLPNKEAKLSYLKDRLNEIKPFDLNYIETAYCSITNSINSYPIRFDGVIQDPNLIIDWITGFGTAYSPELSKYPYFTDIEEEYIRLFTAEHILDKINQINNTVNYEYSTASDFKNDSLKGSLTIKERYSYFFVKINTIIALYEMKCIETEVEHKEIKRLEKLDKFLSTIKGDNNLKKNNKEFWTNYMYAYFLNKSGILDDLRHAFERVGELYQLISTIIELDSKNFSNSLSKVIKINRKTEKEISSYYRRIHKIIDPIINHYKNLV